MTSQLAHQQSSYLRSAKDQPVHWHPWGREAFDRARRETKPVLLDIGAVWCHWCHVMDHESYEDPAIAELLNREWVCIKVDRDERPDVDARYQRAVSALTGQGGWPLTAFLTGDGEVFYGGTYFPPDGKYGRPGFRSVLTELARLYRDDPERVRQQAADVTQHLAKVSGESRAGALTPDVLEQAADAMARAFDFRHGGFGTQPKFPHPGASDFLLGRWFDTRETWQWEIVERTLTGMAMGGIRDHVGGGFHRYAVDARWIVPHFEKMLYDNAELLRAYVRAAAASALVASPAAAAPAEGGHFHRLCLDVARELVTWIDETMSHKRGGYYASQDADVGPDDDGDYFTWTPDEVRAVVDDDEYELLARHYDIAEQGEMHHNPQKNVLWIRQPVEQVAQATGRAAEDIARILASGRAKLRTARERRAAPFVDRTVYTGWSAMMASAMLEACGVLELPDHERHALATLERLFTDAADPAGGLRHAVGSDVTGILDDQVQAANAAVHAYEATGDSRWLDRAVTIMEHVWARYRAADGGLLDTPRDRDGEGFLGRPFKPVQDSPTPSPNSVAGIVLCRLAEHTGADTWRTRSHEVLESFAGGATELAVFASTLLQAIDWAVAPPTHVVVVTDGGPRGAALHRAARRTYRPRKVLKLVSPDERPDTLPPPLRAMLDGTTPRAYVCTELACAEPTDTPERLAEQLATFGVSG